MITTDHILITLLVVSLVMLFGAQASAEMVRCEHCTSEYPCSTLFKFKDLKFVHNVYCEIVDGQEVWKSEDEEKFDVFYFEGPNRSNRSGELDI